MRLYGGLQFAPPPPPLKKPDYYTAFISDNYALKTKNNNSLLYDVTPTCFGFYMAILRQDSKRDLETSLRIDFSN